MKVKVKAEWNFEQSQVHASTTHWNYYKLQKYCKYLAETFVKFEHFSVVVKFLVVAQYRNCWTKHWTAAKFTQYHPEDIHCIACRATEDSTFRRVCPIKPHLSLLVITSICCISAIFNRFILDIVLGLSAVV